MKTELRVDVLEPNVTNYMLYRGTHPSGVTVGALRGQVQNSLEPPSANQILSFVIVWDLVKPTAQAIVKDALTELAKDRLKEWTVEFITNLKARRVRVNDREPKDASDLERIISEEIDIGKND